MLNKLMHGTNILEKALDAAWMRNDVISQNIANVDTPGYKKSVLVFEEKMNEAMSNSKLKGATTNINHIDIGISSIDKVSPEIKKVNNTKMRVDENNVDIDVEMSNLAKNQILYQALIHKISKDFQRIKSVINEGRK